MYQDSSKKPSLNWRTSTIYKTTLAATIVVQRLLEQDLLANNMKFLWRGWISVIRKQIKGRVIEKPLP